MEYIAWNTYNSTSKNVNTIPTTRTPLSLNYIDFPLRVLTYFLQ